MAAGTPDDEHDLAAGDFSAWLGEVQGAIRGERSSDVPCDGCTACCTASQFIHIGPDETESLAHIPAELLFPAPGLPAGHVLMGYDQRGHCPMLVDGRCSIYAHRPRTCRTYDCRVFPAAGVELDDEDKASIAQRVRRWQFGHPTPVDRDEHDAVRSAATFLRAHADSLPDGAAPATSTQLAVLAVQVHEVFLSRDADTGETTVIDPDPDVVCTEVLLRTRAPGSP